ncbi:hypothetical protein BGX21_004886 [Mortierella sp. AD011]|nr:hypothetical protein BGX20_005051 [Mortierella sp. AD010]KAF9400147.1 hypothetical protein BGX21_004886 [Mortierella sp. AD011]
MSMSHADWALSTVNASFPAFIKKFEYEDRDLASKHYSDLLRNKKLRATFREKLQANFNAWKTQSEDLFWQKRMNLRNAKKGIAKAEGALIAEASSNVESTIIQSNKVAKNSSTLSRNTSLVSNAKPKAAAHDEGHDAEGQESIDTESEHHGEESESESESTAGDIQENGFTTQESSNILANITRSQHPFCEWKIEDTCIACLFQDYQKSCIQALEEKTLQKTEIADAIMRAVFKQKILEKLVKPTALPELDIDDAAVTKAVRLRINNRFEDSCETLRSLDRKMRLMFENMLELLPEKTDKTISEATFTVNYVAPLLNNTLKVDRNTTVHFPNTESQVQKGRGIKPDRPDITVKARGHEILYGEITGPCQANNDAKNKWDLFRLARYGKAFLDKGNGFVPLLQVVHDSGSLMRLRMKLRGMYFLEEVGYFTVPCSIATVPTLLATLPTFLAAKEIRALFEKYYLPVHSEVVVALRPISPQTCIRSNDECLPSVDGEGLDILRVEGRFQVVGLPANQSDIRGLVGSIRITRQFHASGVHFNLNAINSRAIAEHKYKRPENRHKPNVKLMHDRREGYGCYLREAQYIDISQSIDKQKSTLG